MTAYFSRRVRLPPNMGLGARFETWAVYSNRGAAPAVSIARAVSTSVQAICLAVLSCAEGNCKEEHLSILQWLVLTDASCPARLFFYALGLQYINSFSRLELLLHSAIKYHHHPRSHCTAEVLHSSCQGGTTVHWW